jgi:hypothetical protein
MVWCVVLRCAVTWCAVLSFDVCQVLGAKRKNLAGYSSSTVQPHQGFIYGSSLIQATPPGKLGSGLTGTCCCILDSAVFVAAGNLT